MKRAIFILAVLLSWLVSLACFATIVRAETIVFYFYGNDKVQNIQEYRVHEWIDNKIANRVGTIYAPTENSKKLKIFGSVNTTKPVAIGDCFVIVPKNAGGEGPPSKPACAPETATASGDPGMILGAAR